MFLPWVVRLVRDLTLKVASARVVQTSVANNSPSQDSSHPDDHFQSRYNMYCKVPSILHFRQCEMDQYSLKR